MEQLNQNWGALPGTILPNSNPGPIEVGMARMGQEGDMLIQQEKLRLQQKQAADKARKEKTEIEFTPVMDVHYGEYNDLISQFENETAAAIQAMERNPLNRDLDINNPSSTSARRLQQMERDIQQAAHVSKFMEDRYAEDLKKYEDGEITAEDLAARKRYYSAPVQEHMSGKLIPPPMIGTYEYQTVYNDIVKNLQTDKTAYAGPNEQGYIFSGSTETISPARLEQAARNMAANPASKHFEFKRRELEKMQSVNPERYKEIAAEAKRKDMTLEQASTWLDLKGMGMTKQTRSAGSDATFNNGMGTGWMKNQDGVDKFIKTGSSIVTDDPEIMKPFDMRTANVPDFVARAIPPDGKVTFTNQYNGILLTPSADKLPIVINGVYKHGNMIYVDRRVAGQEGQTRTTYPGKDQSMMMPGQALPVLQFTEEEFLGSMFEEVAAGNKDLDRETLNRRAKAMNMMQESGNIDPYRGQPKMGAADLILAPTKKGMMD
jgi:hypothetical protein